mmetsp:Transcript_30718/g.39595  ORF Transcript_30718/g.39595 Transcript_30718/m.39595 type:complete len:569 (+) Transcript_30718:628-2334(+)
MIGIRQRHILTGFQSHRSNSLEHDVRPPSIQMKAEAFFFLNYFFMFARWIFLISYLFSFLYSNHHKNQTKATQYLLFLVVCCYSTYLFLLANKKSLRNKESETRLLLHREKRNEELLNGWLPLPWWVAIFELRVAAHKAQLDLKSKVFFKNVTCEELEKVFGNKLLNILKLNNNNEQHIFEDKDKKGASCSTMVLLMYGCLEQSYGTPLYQDDPELPFGNAHDSMMWKKICLIIMFSPFIIDFILQYSNGHDNIYYGKWDIICSISGFILLPLTIIISPQAFISSAIVSIQRKARFQCFLNNILDPKAIVNHEKKWKSKWPYQMDFNNPENFELWGKCRTCIFKFGRRYKERTDVNAGLMVCLLGCATACFILFTAINGQKIYIWDIIYYVFLHLTFVIILGTFSIILSIEGQNCDEFNHRSKIVLSNAMMQFEKKLYQESLSDSSSLSQRHNRDEYHNNLSSVRSSVVQLHSMMESSLVLSHNKVFGMIPLNKALVGSIIFICFTQITLLLENTTLTPPYITISLLFLTFTHTYTLRVYSFPALLSCPPSKSIYNGRDCNIFWIQIL